MRQRRSASQRSTTEWIARAFLAAIAATLGYVAVTRTLAYALRKGNIELAHTLAPGDGRITGLLAGSFVGADSTAVSRARADQLAQAALRQDPTVVAAVFSLGLNAQVRNDTNYARRLFTYAGLLSRRDINTQLWAIEDAVSRGDVNGAVSHYDIALRTSRTSGDLLFPILAGAITDPAIRRSLTKTLILRPSWAPAFINYAAVRGPDPRATARLLMEVRKAGIPVSGGASAEVINLLLFSRFVDDAWSYYSSIHPGVERHRSRDPKFANAGASPSPFDWNTVNDAGISSSVQQGENGGVFDFAVAASVGGLLLHQQQLLSTGEYQLEGHSSGIDQSDEALPYWVLTCSSGRELGRIVVPNSNQTDGRFTGRFSVPPGCPSQSLSLISRPSDKVSGVSGQLDRVQLSPIS